MYLVCNNEVCNDETNLTCHCAVQSMRDELLASCSHARQNPAVTVKVVSTAKKQCVDLQEQSSLLTVHQQLLDLQGMQMQLMPLTANAQSQCYESKSTLVSSCFHSASRDMPENPLA